MKRLTVDQVVAAALRKANPDSGSRSEAASSLG
jgi:hypothetical protein